ncbi:TolC family protein [Ideonella sp. DXS29W]|uniref:TolC family protein n=1 Tax=Ideonella lacteola TaxID=2984193 RepID=A0ABU9BMQ6_9BURK
MTMSGSRWLACAAVAWLSGCAVSPPMGAEYSAAPSAWATLSASVSDEQWRGPTDPALEDLQERALAANRDIGQALLRWKAAQRQVEAAGLARQPTPTLQAGASGSRAFESGSELQRSVSLSVGASYEADLWQRLAHAQDAASAQASAAEADWAAARVLVRARVAEAWWSLAAVAAQAPHLAQQIEGAEQALALTRLRVQEGKLLPIEIDKAAATLQEARFQAAEQAEAAVRQRLALGLLVADPAYAPPTAPALPNDVAADWLARETPTQVLARRPDVQQARAALDATSARLASTEAARYPQLSFNLAVSSGGPHWGDWLKNPLATLSSSLLVPMVDWRRLDLQRLDALDERERAALQLRDTMHRALVEIEQLAAEQRRLQEEHAAQTQRLREASAGERLAEARYVAGAIGRLDWLQARNARLAAEQQGVQLQLRRLLNAVGLQRALVANGVDHPPA